MAHDRVGEKKYLGTAMHHEVYYSILMKPSKHKQAMQKYLFFRGQMSVGYHTS
jgi:hypothetical protein